MEEYDIYDAYIRDSIQKCQVCGDCSQYAYDESYANFILRYDYNLQGALERLEPDCVRIISSQFAIAYKKITGRLSMGRYGYNSFPKCYGLMDSLSTQATNVERVRNLPGLMLTGKNVIFGVIDSGIDYTNPIFRRADGSTRIVSLWDQTEENGNHDYITGYGSVYGEEQLNQALKSDNPKAVVPSADEVGHGTFLASIGAGGKSVEQDFQGMAPDSLLAVVKLKQAKQNIKEFYGINPDAICYQEDDIMSGIRFLLDVSSKQGKPMVILIGVGTSQGDHGGNSYLEQYINRIGNFLWTTVVDAVGNELTHGGHYMSRELSNDRGFGESLSSGNTITGAGSTFPRTGVGGRTESMDIVEINVGEKEHGFTLEIWGQSPGILSVGLESPTGQIYENRTASVAGMTDGEEVRFLYENTKVVVENILIEEDTGDQVVIMRFRNPAEGIWKLRILQDPELVNPYHIWLPIREFLSADTRFLAPEPNVTLCSPANGTLSVTAAGYNHRDDSAYARSSRGYTRNGYRKPDVAAPSVNVFGAWKNGIYTTMSGTSVGAAHLAGAVALILEWAVEQGNYPEINCRIVKQLLIRGARRLPEETYPNRSFGWGILDIAGVFEALRQV